MRQVVQYRHPFTDVYTWKNGIDDMLFGSSHQRLDNALTGNKAHMNVFETENGYIAQIQMPGASEESIEINVEQEKVNIKWSVSNSSPEGAAALWKGIPSGEFSQSFTVAKAIKAGDSIATYKDGVLTLNLPKAEEAKAQTIKIKKGL